MARGLSSGSNKGSLIQRPFIGGSWQKAMVRSMNSTGRQYQLVPGITFHRGHEWNTIRDTTLLMYLTRTGIRSRLFIRANDGIIHIAKALTPRQRRDPVRHAFTLSNGKFGQEDPKGEAMH